MHSCAAERPATGSPRASPRARRRGSVRISGPRTTYGAYCWKKASSWRIVQGERHGGGHKGTRASPGSARHALDQRRRLAADGRQRLAHLQRRSDLRLLSISMDIIIKLPPSTDTDSKVYNTILVVVDYFMKMAKYFPIRTTITTV